MIAANSPTSAMGNGSSRSEQHLQSELSVTAKIMLSGETVNGHNRSELVRGPTNART